MKNRHHYVPQFYLRPFASHPKRINIFNLRRGRGIKDASLRDQCYKHRLYGDTTELEDALASFEGNAAPVLQRITDTKRPPTRQSQDYYFLVAFVALQHLRTTAAIKRLRQASDKLTDVAFRDSPNQRFATPSTDESIVMSLQMMPRMVDALEDLIPHVIQVGTTGAFIASDNPVYRYNSYCEGVNGAGVTGGVCRGLQIFLPISPQTAVLLYDGDVYKVGKRGVSESSVATEADIFAINLMQFIGAEHNVFFARWDQLETLGLAVRKAKKHRRAARVHVTEAVEVDNERSTLLHQFEQMPNLQMHLSFVKVRRQARRTRLFDRAMQLRKPIPGEDYDPPDPWKDGRKRVFHVKE